MKLQTVLNPLKKKLHSHKMTCLPRVRKTYLPVFCLQGYFLCHRTEVDIPAIITLSELLFV